MATCYSLKTVSFLKRKQGELLELQGFWKELPPESHGLHGYLREDVLAKLAPVLASHTYCLYVCLQDRLGLLALASLACLSMPRGLPEWVYTSHRADLAIGYLEQEEGWVTDELLLAVKDFKKHGLLAKETVAPDQLLLQWYLERLEEALIFLLERPPAVSEEDKELVEETFRTGREMLNKNPSLLS
jgi:hypothetical protein